MMGLKVRYGLVVLCLSLGTLAALGSGKAPPSSGGRGGLRCAAYDAGSTEEHGPHSSCSGCLASHPNCEERCFTYSFTCTAEGYREDQSGNQTRETISGDGYSEFDAKRRAEDKCYYEGLRGCSVKSCSEESYLDSTRSCK